MRDVPRFFLNPTGHFLISSAEFALAGNCRSGENWDGPDAHQSPLVEKPGKSRLFPIFQLSNTTKGGAASVIVSADRNQGWARPPNASIVIVKLFLRS